MAGIEKITGEIISAANGSADEIIKKANSDAKAILDEALKSADICENEILSAAAKKADSIKNAAESACALDAKNKILNAKMELISSAFLSAVEKLNSLDTKEYFEVLEKLITAYAVSGEGVVFLSQKDLDRMPSSFESSLSDKMPSGKKVIVSKNADNSISGGCVIKYDEIEINCEFQAIIASEKERLIDSVNSCLF